MTTQEIKKQIEENRKEISKIDNRLLYITSLKSNKRIELQNRRLKLQEINLDLAFELITK